MYDHSVINLLTLVLMLFTAVRLTRLVVYDKITMPLRAAIIKAAEKRKPSHPLHQLVYLLHCEWCTGLWMAFAVTVPVLLFPASKILYGALVALAIAEIAPRILIWEPRSR